MQQILGRQAQAVNTDGGERVPRAPARGPGSKRAEGDVPAPARKSPGKPSARAGEAAEKDEAGAPKGTAEGGDAAAGAGEAPAVRLFMPPAPVAPSKASAARLAAVKTRAGKTAKAQGKLPAADKQVAGARQAVTPPDAQRDAEARAQLIAAIPAAPSPEIVELCRRIREVIRNKRPPDEDALAKAEPAKAAAEAGDELNSTVQGESKKVQDNYDGLNKPAGPEQAKPGDPLTPQPAAAQTAPVDAKAAVPDAVPAQDVSLDKDAAASQKQIDDAGMNKPAAQLVQSGPIAEARAAQGELDQVAAADPQEVLARQKEALVQADNDMAALQAQALEALTSARAGTAQKATLGQHGMVGNEEQRRAHAGAEAKAVFNKAQADVQAQLKPLIPAAMAKWDAAKTAMTQRFKDELKVVKDRVDERHSGIGGWFTSKWDWAFGLPSWATKAYDKAENDFAEGVIAKLTEISIEVNSVIEACQAIIKAAREKIAAIFAALPESLQGWAAQEQAKFSAQLDKLDKHVIAARDDFDKDLSARASAAVDEVRAEISELRKKAGGIVGRIVDAVKRFVDDPWKFIIEGLLELVGISPPAFWAVVAKIKKAISDIADDPIGFGNNLLKGIGQGFSQFFDNFAGHMVRGFLTWLLGDLKGVQIPKDLSLRSIITFFLQIMGITWPNIRKIIAKKIGEKNVALIERVYSLVSMLIEQGPTGIYEMIKERLNPQAIVDQVIQMAIEFMVTAIVKQVAVRLLLLFNPAGAIIQAIEAIYRVLKWVFENAARIFTLVETIVNGIADIVAGNVGGFAKAVESGLAQLIPPVLSFIADYFSLGDLPAKVAKTIEGMRAWILGKIEAGLDWLIAKGKALLAAVGIGGKEKAEGKDSQNAYDGQIGKVVKWHAEEESHELWIEESGGTPEVMMASTNKGPVKAKLTEYEAKVGKIKGADAEKRKERATDAIMEAHGLLAKTLAAALATKHALADQVSKPEDADKAAKKAEEADDKTEGWEDALCPQLQTIQIALRLVELPKTVILPGAGQASTVSARPLSKKGSGGSRPRGKLKGWPLVAGQKIQWVAAHLVSEKLHGPGDPWNTTPMRSRDNTNMERGIERLAKTQVENEEVLYYTASVNYHQDTDVRMNDFPSSISISWGSMRYQNGTWADGAAYKSYGKTLEKPGLDDGDAPNINELRRVALYKRLVPISFAMAMDDERDKGGPFEDANDFEQRMSRKYKTRGGAAAANLKAGIAAVEKIIASSQAKWPR